MADPELNWDLGARGIDIVLAQVKEGGGGGGQLLSLKAIHAHLYIIFFSNNISSFPTP